MAGLLERLRETLEAIEVEWSRLGAPVLDALRPGLNNTQIDDLALRYGWSIPPELRVWWSWHDGAAPSQPRSIGPGGYSFLGLEEALQATTAQRTLFSGPHAQPLVWDERWLLLMNQDAQRLFLNTTPRPTLDPGVFPLGRAPFEWSGAHLDWMPSLLTAADLWLWLLQNDYYVVEAGGDLYPSEFAKWPFWLRVLSG